MTENQKKVQGQTKQGQSTKVLKIETEEENPVKPGNILDVSIEVYQAFMVQRRKFLVQ